MQIEEKQQQSQFKQKWFDFTKQLASNQISINLYRLFIIIQSLQFIAFHSNGLIKYTAFGLDIIAECFQYINLYPLMLKQNINIFLVPIFTIITALHIVMVIFGFKAYHKKMELKNKSIEDRNFHKNRLEYFINLQMILFNTVLTIPIAQTSVTSIYCLASAPFTNNNNCYSTSQLSVAFLALLNLLWLLTSNIFFALYYYTRNPFSTNYLACSSHWWNLGKFGIKLIPIFYFAYDPQLAYPVLFLVMMNACFISYIGLFRILLPYYRYNFDLEKFVHFIEDIVLMVNLSFVAMYALNKGKQISGQKGIILVFWIIGSFLFAKMRLDYFTYKKNQLINGIHSLEKIKLEGVLEYIIYLIYSFQKEVKRNSHGLFIGNLAKTHNDLCRNQNCYCFSYFETINENRQFSTIQEGFYSIMLSIIDRVIEQNKKAYSFIILKAYILNSKMKSQIKAATTIAMIMQDKLDFSDQTLVKGLLFQLHEQYLDTRDMEIYRKFNQFLLRQEDQSMKLVNYYLQYWQELIDQSSSIPKLHRLLNNIKTSKRQLQNIVQSSLDIFRNHVRVLLLYKNFLKEVLNDYMGYLKYEQKHKIGLKEHKLSNVDAVNTIQFRPNQNLLVINFTRHYSAHSDIVGNFKIISISSNVKDFLGFTNVQLKGQSLNKLIPRLYQGVHDSYIDKILDKKDSDIHTRQIRIFPVNSIGHIIQCNIISKFMPSLTTGINIVSFLEECDKCKDEYFIIYDKRSGIVDAMNEQAQKTLKDVSHRKQTDMLVIPDHINDIVPNWDYKNQIWRDGAVGKGKSLKSLNSLTEPKYDLREIEIVRADGAGKYIKVLKFKGDFFTRMFSFDNMESYKQSNTIQQYLQYRKEKTFSNMNSKQLQDLICVQTYKLIERDRQKKKTIQKLQKSQKAKIIVIQAKPPKLTQTYFICVQSIILLLALGLLFYEFIITNINLNLYFEDVELLDNLNSVQSYLSDTTFILSLTVTKMAYSSNMSLPYSNFSSSIQQSVQIQQMNEKYAQLNKVITSVNSVLVDKILKNDIPQHTLFVNVRYLNNTKNKQFYEQRSDIVQAVLQHLLYGEEICFRIEKGEQFIQDILEQPGFYYIFANNIDVLPIQILSIKNEVVRSIVNRLKFSYHQFLIIKMVSAALVVLSAIVIVIYYNFLYKHYILQVLQMYQRIKVNQIKIYQQKCLKYKASLSDRTDIVQTKQAKPAQMISISQIEKSEQGRSPPLSEIVMNISQEEHKLLQKQQKGQEYEHLLNFQEMPKVWKNTIVLLIWISVYGLILFLLLQSYLKGINTLQFQIQRLNNYSNLQQSVVEIRLFSQLSLNMLNYWDKQSLKTIFAQLQEQFATAVRSMDDKSLDTAAISSQFATKYLQLRYLQSLVIQNDFKTLASMVNSVQAQLQEMDDLITSLEKLTTNYLPFVQEDSQWIATVLNISISGEFLFIVVYWMVGVRLIYRRLLKEHEDTYEMHNIISYNLRKEIEGG